MRPMPKPDRSRRHWLAAAALLPLGLRAQPRFPERPITLLVPFAPGGIADLTARAVAEQMARSLGQPVIVDNRPSAGSIVASQAVATARPDGHTLLLMSNANAVSVGLFRRLGYDPVKDFAAGGHAGLLRPGPVRHCVVALRDAEGRAGLRPTPTPAG